MTAWGLFQLAPRRRGVNRRVRVRVHRPKPVVPRVAPAKCGRCPIRCQWRPSFLPRCRWCADTGVWTEWRKEPPGRPVQHAVQ